MVSVVTDRPSVPKDEIAELITPWFETKTARLPASAASLGDGATHRGSSASPANNHLLCCMQALDKFCVLFGRRPPNPS
jgi:hypothetical protein